MEPDEDTVSPPAHLLESVREERLCSRGQIFSFYQSRSVRCQTLISSTATQFANGPGTSDSKATASTQRTPQATSRDSSGTDRLNWDLGGSNAIPGVNVFVRVTLRWLIPNKGSSKVDSQSACILSVNILRQVVLKSLKLLTSDDNTAHKYSTLFHGGNVSSERPQETNDDQTRDEGIITASNRCRQTSSKNIWGGGRGGLKSKSEGAVSTQTEAQKTPHASKTGRELIGDVGFQTSLRRRSYPGLRRQRPKLLIERSADLQPKIITFDQVRSTISTRNIETNAQTQLPHAKRNDRLVSPSKCSKKLRPHGLRTHQSSNRTRPTASRRAKESRHLTIRFPARPT